MPQQAGGTGGEEFPQPIPTDTMLDNRPPPVRKTPEQRLAHIEDLSGGTLPSSLGLALAQSNMDDPGIARASTLLAHQFDLPPSWFFDKSRPAIVDFARARREDYTAPVASFHEPGDPTRDLSWATAKRIVRPFEPAVISSILGSKGYVEGDPKTARLIKVVEAMAPIAGEDVAFTNVLAAAEQIASSQLDPTLFASNLRVAASSPSLPPLASIALAQEATEQGLAFQTLADVAKLAIPDVAEGIDQAAELRRRRDQLTPEYIAVHPELAAPQLPGTPGYVEPGQLLKASLGAGVVGAFQLPGRLADMIQERQMDYVIAGQELAAQTKIPFSNSIVGKAVGKVLNVINRPLGAIVRVGFTPITSFTDKNPGFDTEGFRDAWDILKGATNEFTELEEAGVPWYMTAAVELAISVGFDVPGTNIHVPSLDPLIFIGQMRASTNLGRTVFGVAEKGQIDRWPSFVENWIRGPVGKIGDMRNLSVSKYLLREADRARNPEIAFTRAVDNFRTTFGTEGIHPMVSERIWRWANSTRGKIPEEMRLRGVEGVLLGGLGVTPEIGSLSEDVSRYVRAARETTRVELPPAIEAMARFNANRGPVAVAEGLGHDAETALGVLSDTSLSLVNHGAQMVELPRLAGPVTRLEHTLRTSGMADTGMGRWVRHVVGLAPRQVGTSLVLNIEEAGQAERDFQRYLIRSRLYSPEEIAKGRLEFNAAVRADNPTRELNFMDVMQRYDKDSISRLAKSYGIDQSWMDDIVEKLDSKFGSRRKQVFGVETKTGATGTLEPQEVRDPFMVTQRPNEWTLHDPVKMREGIAETIGTWRQYRSAIAKHFPAGVPGAKPVHIPLRRFTDDMGDLLVRDLFMSWWKPLVVARPAYVLRVAGLEEQSRFIATVGLTRRLESGPHGARVLSRLDAFRSEARGGGFADIPVEGLTEPLRFPRPGMLPNEPLANNVASRYALASEEGPARRMLQSMMPGKWGVVEPSDPHFYDWWFNGLAHQFGLDPLGRRYLDDVARGLGEQESADAAMRWLLDGKGEGPRYVQRLMGQPLGEVSIEAIRGQVERGVRIARDLTRGNKNIATAARDGLLRLEDLKLIPKKDLPPFVAGPLAHEQVLAKVGPGKRALDAWTRWILEEPTNRLSRQPYFKSWYDRVYHALVTEAQASGQELTPELIKGFQQTAKRFGVTQVRRIMFDLSRQGRIDEMTSGLLVFVQPYLEWPVAWSRIIRQNPAVVGYVTRLGRLATESGFVRKDPDTGEMVVPLSWWAGAAPLLAALTGGHMSPAFKGGGWELSVPLTSFNMFASSTFGIPTGGLAGDLPIPLPNFNPEALGIIQQLVAHDALVPGDLSASLKAKLSSWLFAYGEVSPANPAALLPAYLRHGLMAAMGETWFKKETDLQATNFLQVQQAMGLEPNADHATAQAREYAGLRAFFAFVFPGAPRIEFPTVEIEREWSDMVETSPSYSDAITAWGVKHPDLSLIPLARTMWAADNPSPVPISPNAFVGQLLETKGAEQFAKDHPRWVWAIIPHELQEGELDFGSWFAQLASGQREVLSPERFLGEDQIQKGWDAYFMERDAWLAWQEAHPQIGIGDPSYEQKSNEYQLAIEDLRETNPDWGVISGNIDISGVDPNVMAESRSLARDKTFTKTDVGKGLVAYLALRDSISDDLAAHGASSIQTVLAERLGLASEFTDGVADIVDQYPDFNTAYRLFFASDLQHVETAGDKALAGVPQDVYDDKITPWWDRYERLKDKPNLAGNVNDRNAAYEGIRMFVERAYEEFPRSQNPMILRWKTYDDSERQDYLVSMIGRSYGFNSRFDRVELLGDKSSKAAEKFWTDYNTARTAISNQDDHDPNFAAGDAYTALDRWVLGQAAKNPIIRNQLEASNTWGYAFRKVLPEMFPQRRRSQPYWDAFLDSVATVQQVVIAKELHGDASFDPNEKVLYTRLKEVLEGYVGTLREENLQFREQWRFLEDASGPDPLLDYFMPAVFFATGSDQLNKIGS
jgi:hypothetical protein